jgi:hypothetical protein
MDNGGDRSSASQISGLTVPEGKSTFTVPEFRTANEYLHHHGRFFGNVHQLGSEMVNLSHSNAVHQSTLEVLAKDIGGLESTVEEINTKIDTNKEQLRSFIRNDLAEIIQQQLDAIMHKRHGTVNHSIASSNSHSHSQSHQGSDQSSNARSNQSSSPPPLVTRDTAGDDDDPSWHPSSSSSSDTSSSEEDPVPRSSKLPRKKKSTSSQGSIPSTVQVSLGTSSDNSTDSLTAAANEPPPKSSELVTALTETLKLAIPAREIKLTALQKESKLEEELT